MSNIVLVREEYQRPDGYVSATKLCKTAGKLWADYYRLETTKTFLEALSQNMGIPIFELVIVARGRNGGTWVHPRVATNLAQWLSPEFAVQVSDWVYQLMSNGVVAIAADPKEQVLEVYAERARLSVESIRDLPDTHWCVFQECMQLMVYVERVLKMPVDRFDLIDGSIGKRWSAYREGREWAGDRIKIKYRFPDGRCCNPWAYPLNELGHFRHFMKAIYQKQHLPEYLKGKYGAIVKVEG